MADNPQHNWSELKPEALPTVKKKMGEHFDYAAHTPNNPKHEDIPSHYNVSYDYNEPSDND